MEALNTYDEIIKFLNSITGSNPQHIEAEKEKQLATLMINFAHNGSPISLLILQTIKNDATEEDVNHLNKIFYHFFIKEIARWMLPWCTKENPYTVDEDHELPFAIAQARALRLIREGYLTIAEVFSMNAPYGIVTGKNIGININNAREKLIRINALYDKVILEKKSENFLPYVQCWKKNPSLTTVPTRKEFHRELQETFGGESDTDGEGYESDDLRENLCNKIRNAI